MDTQTSIDPAEVLQQWRIRITNNFLVIIAIAAVPAWVTIVVSAVSAPDLWPVALLFAAGGLALIALAALRRVDIRIRLFGVVLIGYAAAIVNLLTRGLVGAGPLYLLTIPVLALILMGRRAGILASVLSTILATVFVTLIDRGLLVLGPLSVSQAMGLSTLLLFLIAVMTLLILFYGFQERLIAQERRTHADLLHAQSLLEQQNVTLEQKIQERTSELQASNLNLEQRNEELAMLSSVGQAMVETIDVKTMARLVGDQVRQLFDAESALIMLLDRLTNLIHVPYEYDRNEGGYIDYVEPFPLGTGLSSKVIISGQPLILGTLEDEMANGAYFPPEIIERGTGSLSQSWLGVPIMANEQTLGLIALSDARPHAFNENQLRLLQTLSANVGAALENARLFDETQRLLDETEQRNTELAIINRVQEALASQLDLLAIYELIGEEVREVFNVQVVDIVIYDAAAHLIAMPYSYEKGDRSVISPREPYGFRLQVINSGAPLLINEHFAELAAQYNNPVLTGDWPQSALFVPLLVAGKVKGVISIQDLEQENAFSASDVRLLQTLANAMSVAIENAHLFQAEQQRAAELAAVNTVSAALAGELDLNALIHLVGEQTRSLFKADIAYVALLDETDARIDFVYTYGEDLASINYGEGLTSKVIETNQPLLINQELDRQSPGNWRDGRRQEIAVLPRRSHQRQRPGCRRVERPEHLAGRHLPRGRRPSAQHHCLRRRHSPAQRPTL